MMRRATGAMAALALAGAGAWADEGADVRRLVEAADRSDVGARLRAVRDLQRLGGNAYVATHVLSCIFYEESPVLDEPAFVALVAIEQDIVRALVRNLRARGAAGFELGVPERIADAALPTLLEELGGHDAQAGARDLALLVAAHAMQNLKGLCGHARRAPAPRVGNLDGGQKRAIAAAFGRALDAPDPRVRAHAVHGLAHLGDDAAVAAPRILRALRDRDREVRILAALSLGCWLRVDAGAGLDDLVRMLDDDRPRAVLAAILALSTLRERARPAAPRLMAIVDAGHPRLVETAESVLLGCFGGRRPDLLGSYVRRACTAVAEDDRSIAARLLVRAGVEVRTVRRDLEQALRNERPVTRRNAARTVGMLGREAIPLLRTLRALEARPDEDEGVREACRAAIRLIERSFS